MHWIKPVVAVRVSLQQIFRLYGIKLNRALARFDVRKLDAADAIDQVRALAGFQRVDLSLMYGRRKTVPRHAVDVHAVGGNRAAFECGGGAIPVCRRRLPRAASAARRLAAGISMLKVNAHRVIA